MARQSFSGRVIAITGAASGIGQALAVELAARGADVALADMNEVGLADTAQRVQALRRKVTAERLDVADRDAVYGFAGRMIESFGRVDGIVNNAGVSLTDTVEHATYEDLEWIVGINFWGVVHGTKAFLPHLIENGDGWVVNLSSVFGIIAIPTQSAYNATKFAVRGFTESLRQELHGTGVTATCVHPGGVKTNIVRSQRFRHGFGVDSKEQSVKDFDQRLARTTSEEAAIQIADGMDARAPRILVGPDARLIDVVQRLLPVRYTEVLRALATRR